MSIKTLDINKCYFHSFLDSSKIALQKFEGILSSGYIKRACDLGIVRERIFSKPNEICLAKYCKEDECYSNTFSSFDVFMQQSLTLILDDDIKTYKPILIPEYLVNEDVKVTGLYTNIYDEYRTKFPISI